MKATKINLLFIILAISGLMITGCKKDNTKPTSTTLTSQQIDQVQNSDVQDALAEKTDDDIDKSLNQLQATNFKVPVAKSLSSGSLVITVNHPDSTTFPKVITLVYTNFGDSTAFESFIKNGEIDVTINADPTDKQLVSWALAFKNFSITTDSTTVTINGTRNVVRTAHSFKYSGLQGARFTATDNVTANTRWAITKTGVSDTLTFTRVVDRVRKSIVYFDNFGLAPWRFAILRNNLSKDTTTITGTVTGVNEKGESYSKIVNVTTPLIVTFYRATPIISSGTMDYTTTGTPPGSYTITFKEDPAHPRYTLVTVTNNTTSKTHSFDRRFGRLFRRWW